MRIVVAIVLLAAGTLLFWIEAPGASLVLVIAVVTFAVGSIQYLSGCSWCRLGPEGFEVSNLFRKRRYAWKDVREFHVSRLGPLECVVISLRDAEPHAEQESAAAMLHAITCECAIPDSYGLRAGALAVLLNERLAAATARP